MRVTTTLTHEVRLLFDITRRELEYYWEMTEQELAAWDRRDGTRLLVTFKAFKALVVPKNSEYWGMGWRQDDKTAAADHDATLVMIYALRWLIRHSPASNMGLSPTELWRKLQDDTGRGIADLDILTEARTKALKRTPAALAVSGGIAAPSATGGTSSGAATGPTPAGGDGHLHGPVPGQEPSAEAVQLVEMRAMDSACCLNCKQAGHCLLRCPVTTRDFLQLPCAMCYGAHWESGCWGPAHARSLWGIRRTHIFRRADNAVKNQGLRSGHGGGGGNAKGSGGASGDGAPAGEGGAGGPAPALGV